MSEQHDTDTREQVLVLDDPLAEPATPDGPVEPRRGGWISDGTRAPGRHRADRAGLQHVSAIEGVDLGRRRMPRAVGAESILARLIPGGAR
jgi:hypothetical protein